MLEKKKLEELFEKHGFTDFKWINTKDIIVSQWVRFRCMYGCASYGKCGTCPPYVPSVDECRKMISEYNDAVVFHFQKQVANPEDRKPWSRKTILKLLELEREVFLSGCYKTLLVSFDNCGLCEECSGNRIDCKNPKMLRPGAEAMGIDIYSTVRGIGYPIQVLKDYNEVMNRYAFLLIE
ncbi:MAG: DUF2284 domain-containing protein [Bacillota bacterium]